MPTRKIENPILLERARSNRRNATLSESMLWRGLRDRRLFKLKFRRQYIIDHFIVDFYYVEQNLIVEIDGEAHIGQEKYDRNRQEFLERKGHRVIRFSTEAVESNLQTVLEEIAVQCGIENPRV